MGKTTFALNCAYNASKEYGKKVAFFSLEMGEEQLTMKLLSMQSDVNLTAMRNGTLSLGDIDRLHSERAKAPKGIIIEDTSALSINNLRSKARKLKQKHDIDMIVIDYLQLMTCEIKGNDNRESEIRKISSGLKSLAKELKVPIIALSQLSREVEKRGGLKKPMLSDLRESGSLEQDADIVMFLWRPEYYKMNSIEFEGANYSSENIVLMDIAKHRNGANGDLLLNFYMAKSKFDDFNPAIATEVERETTKKGKPIF
jgi:replicative DNA helicase